MPVNIQRSILWEFSYWKTNILYYNLAIMHIEKNVFENIFNMVMDMKGKTNDNNKTSGITHFWIIPQNLPFSLLK